MISRENNAFTTNVYKKPTFSGVYTNYNSFIYESYKFGLVYTLIFRVFSLVSDLSKFHSELDKLKIVLSKNNYPIDLIDNCVKLFLDKMHKLRPVVATVEKKELMIVLPFLGSNSLSIRTRLQNNLKKTLPFCKIKVIFTSNVRLSSFFSFKDKMPKCLISNIVYKFKCGCCNASYYGKTYRHFKTRASEHAGVSHLTGKRTNSANTSAVKDHMLVCDHQVTFEDFSVLATANNNFKLEIKESLLISRDKPILNRNISSLPLYLFY